LVHEYLHAEITVPTPAPKAEVPVLSEQEERTQKVYYDKAAVWVAHEAQLNVEPFTATERRTYKEMMQAYQPWMKIPSAKRV
jgi:hypothetical protein